MTIDEGRHNGPDSEDGLCQSMWLRWRIRCAVEQAALAATSRPEAEALCAAVVRTLEHGSSEPSLAFAARTWVADVFSPVEARAALLCLCEVATELSNETLDEMTGLDPVLECLVNEAAACSARRIDRVSIDSLTGCRDSRTLEGDLELAVGSVAAVGGDVALAMVILRDSPSGSRDHPARRRGKNPSTADDVVVLNLVATLRSLLRPADELYRVGKRKFVVLAPETNAAGVGELLLLATCAPGPPFAWGVADLSSTGTEAAQNPNVLLLLAEADLVIRRRDFSQATALLTKRRRMSALVSVAAVTALAGSITLGLDSSAGVPVDQPYVALHTRVTSNPPVHALSPSLVPGTPKSVPVPVPAPLPGAGAASTGSLDNVSASVSPPTTVVSLVANQPPRPSLAAPLPAPAAPLPTPAAPLPTPATPQGPTSPVAHEGHSASAPGQLKGRGNSPKPA
jgi:GGDEF domain-containing protein